MDASINNIAVLIVSLLLLGNTLAVAPGDEDRNCEKPYYPPNTEVLLDSFRYQSLIAVHKPNNNTGWYIFSEWCQESAVAVCVGDQMLRTQDIIPCSAADTNPVRVFVNITVKPLKCEGSPCARSLELQLVHYDINQDPYYDNATILPGNVISTTTGATVTHINVYFDLNVTENRFALAVISRSNACIILRRLIIYQHNDYQALGTISPELETYHVMEEAGRVCFASSQTNSGVTVQVQTHDGTAVGNYDYTLINTTISFEREQPECVDIQIASDSLTEGDENFTVVLTKGCVIVSSVNVIISGNSDSLSPCTEGSVSVVRDIYMSSYKLVEMCSSEGVWTTACDYNWTAQDATVICRELGYAGLARMKILEGSSYHSIMVPDCNGNENKIINCLSPNRLSTICHHLLVVCKDYHSSVVTTSSIAPTTHPSSISVSSQTPPVQGTDHNNGIPIAGIVSMSIIIVILIVIIALLLGFVLALLRRHCKHSSDQNAKRSEEVSDRDSSSDKVHMQGNPLYGLRAHTTSLHDLKNPKNGNEDSSDNVVVQKNPVYGLQDLKNAKDGKQDSMSSHGAHMQGNPLHGLQAPPQNLRAQDGSAVEEEAISTQHCMHSMRTNSEANISGEPVYEDII